MADQEGALSHYEFSEFDFEPALREYMRRRAEALSQQDSQRSGSLADPEGFLSQGIGFGAGLVDPFGLNSWAARRLMPNNSRVQAVTQMLDAGHRNAPVASAIGSAIVPTAVGGRLAGLTMREALHPGFLGSGALLSNSIRQLYDLFASPEPWINRPTPSQSGADRTGVGNVPY